MKPPAIALAITLAACSAAAAQSWEGPTFRAPGAADDIGLHLVDGKGSDAGLAAIWRQSGRLDLGVRAGFGGPSGDRAWMVGAELAGTIVEPGPSRLLAATWVAGAGASFDGATWLRLPAGVSVGLRFGGDVVAFTPYVHPRLSLDHVESARVADDLEVTSTEINADVDLGAELELGGAWLIRAAVTFGDREAFGVGVARRIPRGVSVR